MNRSALASRLFSVIVLVATAVALSAVPQPSEWNDDIRARVVNDIGVLVPRHFAHWQALPGDDFASRFAAYADAARPMRDRREFSLLTRRFIASLHNGHTQFADDELLAQDAGALGFSLRHVDEKWVVTHSRRPGLAAGSVVEKIEGVALEDFFRSRQDRISGSNERMQRYVFGLDRTLFPPRFELQIDNATRIAVDRTSPLPDAQPRPQVEHRWIEEGRVAYLRIGSFGQDEYEKMALAALTQSYASARHIIIDVRDNGGGNTPSRLGRAMLGRDWQRWRTRPPARAVAVKRRPLPDNPRYLILLNRGCASACDDFAMPMSLSAQALLIGETSGGSSGQPEFKDWGNGMRLSIGARRQWFPDGREFEGVGVAPDIELAPRVDDFRDGAADRALACAQRISVDTSLRSCDQ
jgi:carboxyl-terminal processing protease